MKLRVVISWVPFPKGSAREDHQLKVWGQLVELAPPWCEVVVALLDGEPDPGLNLEPTVLPRRADVAGDSDRPLPYLRDMVDVALNSDVTWGGFLNSDIVVTPEFFSVIEHLSPTTSMVLCHRTDILRLGGGLQNSRRQRAPGCSDGCFFHRDTWKQRRDTVPDYIIGEAAWDRGMWLWSRVHEVDVRHMSDDEILHVQLRPLWYRWSRGAKYNRAFNVELAQTL